MISEKITRKDKASKLLDLKLDYEVKPIQLKNGQSFNPLKDSTKRWIGTRHTRLPFWGLTCEVLYLTHESNWILSVAEACIRRQGIWSFCSTLRTRLVNDSEAWEYFQDFGLPRPYSLAVRGIELMKESEEFHSNTPMKPCEENRRYLWQFIRSEANWIGAMREEWRIYGQYHEFCSREYLREIGDYLISLIQDMKRWILYDDRMLSKDARKIAPLLAGGLAVNKHEWDWNCGRIPPESLDILELEWESDTLKLQEAVRWFRTEFLMSLCCLDLAMQTNAKEMPNEHEIHGAKCVLIAYREDIEEIALRINQLVNLVHSQRDLEIQEPEDQQQLDSVPTEKGATFVVEEVQESEQADDADEEQESMSPVLRIVREGFHYNGQFQRLTPKPLQLLLLMANSPGGMVTFVRAQDIVWEETSIEPNAINRTVSKIRAAIRACLFLSDSVDPIPCKGTGRNSSWKLGFQFQLIDESESWN